MYNLYYHNGSKNHGCEAIVRSTVKILGENERVVLYSTKSDEDLKYKINEICEVVQDSYLPPRKKSISYFVTAIKSKLTKNDYPWIYYGHKAFFDNVKKANICLSIGGDNYCYTGLDILESYNKALKKRKAKTVLWGCSVEPEIVNEIQRDLSRYDCIFARESISYEVLCKVNSNTYLFPDPAFQLDIIEKDLPEGFKENNTIGINVSPLIMDYEEKEGMTKKNYIELISYIIDNTDLQVALIPHVVSVGSDDRKNLAEIYEVFKKSGRVFMIPDCNCMELKGFVKRCRFVVAARTHLSIAAYSTCVPTIVVGYSVKAKGIAKDIFGTYDNYVLPVQSLTESTSLIRKFQWLMENEDYIRSHLRKFMPEYCKKALLAGEKIKEISS